MIEFTPAQKAMGERRRRRRKMAEAEDLEWAAKSNDQRLVWQHSRTRRTQKEGRTMRRRAYAIRRDALWSYAWREFWGRLEWGGELGQ